MIQDLHAHTYYSFCSKDRPEKVIETAINNGIDMLGICDHNYGIGCSTTEVCWSDFNVKSYGNNLVKYYDHISALKEKFKNKIKILCGIEVRTASKEKNYFLPENTDISFFDFCLVENFDENTSSLKGDIVGFAKKSNTTVGIAHTDLFKYVSKIGENPYRFFSTLAKNGIFWELNVNMDSLHNFKTHDYVTEFFKNKEQQKIVKESGIRLSVGFDSHIISEYKAQKIINACNLIKSMGIPLVFNHL